MLTIYSPVQRTHRPCPGRKPHPFRSQPQWIENRGPWMVWGAENGWGELVGQGDIPLIQQVGD